MSRDTAMNSRSIRHGEYHDASLILSTAMATSLSFKKITPDEFATYLNRYDGTVPDSLRELDEYRFVTIPGLLKERRGKKGGAWLEREEVQKLVEWKL